MPKYTLPSAEYETRTDSVLAWKKAQQLGRFDPDAPSLEQQKIRASEREIEERGKCTSCLVMRSRKSYGCGGLGEAKTKAITSRGSVPWQDMLAPARSAKRWCFMYYRKRTSAYRRLTFSKSPCLLQRGFVMSHPAICDGRGPHQTIASPAPRRAVTLRNTLFLLPL